MIGNHKFGFRQVIKMNFRLINRTKLGYLIIYINAIIVTWIVFLSYCCILHMMHFSIGSNLA